MSELESKKSGGEQENERLTRAIADKEAEAIAVNQKKTDTEHQLLDLQVRARRKMDFRGERLIHSCASRPSIRPRWMWCVCRSMG